MATSKSRAYDSLYDPSYTVSGARDHYREQSKANGLYVERVPDYSNFFSELRTHPSSSYRFKLNDKIPQVHIYIYIFRYVFIYLFIYIYIY